jgi:hypothetical protein
VRPTQPPDAPPPATGRREFLATLAAGLASCLPVLSVLPGLSRAASRAGRPTGPSRELEKDREALRGTLKSLREFKIRPEVEPAFPYGDSNPTVWRK